MAFSFTIDTENKDTCGQTVILSGTYTNGTVTDTGGTITTNLNRIIPNTIKITPTGASVATNQSVVSSADAAGAYFVIVTDGDQDGYWEVRGYE